MKDSINANEKGIPPVITTTDKCDEDILDMESLHLAMNPTVFDKSNGVISDEKDESTAESSGFSSCDGTQSECSFNEESDNESSSAQSQHTIDSTRLLLKQAQQRLHHQSVYEEVKLLRSELSQYKRSVDSTMRQKLDLKNRCNTLESELARARESIQSYKLKELWWMNQLNDVCSSMGAKEQDLMTEIIKRDEKIIELQNLWNEEEIRRMRAAKENKTSDVTSPMKVRARKEMQLDDDSWSDDCCCEFV